LAVACLGSQDQASTGPGQEERRIVAGVDLSRHSVPLDNIHFDTFTGGSIPLSDITQEDVLRLRDAIPPLDNPKYDRASGGDWLDDSDLVIGYMTDGGATWAYPLKILHFHEIVNDEIEGLSVLVSYCPLCRSGIVYDRHLEGMLLTFGNTSALYESDLVMFDRQTNSFWWQTAGEAIVGTLTGRRLTALPSVTITWGEWKALHPDTQVLSRDTGFAIPYERDPYATYADLVDSGRLPFPVSDAVRDGRLAPADEVLGVTLGGESKAYPLRHLGDAVVNDSLAGKRLVVLSSTSGPSGNVFLAMSDGRELTFPFRDGAYADEETGSKWNLSGEATSGPLKGNRLEQLPSRYTFWFAYVAAFPQTEVYAP
jgi:hypothetical protein